MRLLTLRLWRTSKSASKIWGLKYHRFHEGAQHCHSCTWPWHHEILDFYQKVEAKCALNDYGVSEHCMMSLEPITHEIQEKKGLTSRCATGKNILQVQHLKGQEQQTSQQTLCC